MRRSSSRLVTEWSEERRKDRRFFRRSPEQGLESSAAARVKPGKPPGLVPLPESNRSRVGGGQRTASVRLAPSLPVQVAVPLLAERTRLCCLPTGRPPRGKLLPRQERDSRGQRQRLACGAK